MQSFIGKNNRKDKMWLPLWVHSYDTFCVMEYLTGEWMSADNADLFTCSLSGKEFRTIAGALALLHDIGKASTVFQSRITEGEDLVLRDMLVKEGLDVPSAEDTDMHDASQMRHDAAGEMLLLANGCHPSIAAIIGAHHGIPWAEGRDISDDIEECLEESKDELLSQFRFGPRLWGNKNRRREWIRAQEEFIQWVLDTAGLVSLASLPAVPNEDAVRLSGLLIMADWLASNEAYFPLLPYGTMTVEDVDNRVREGLRRISLPPSWSPNGTDDIVGLTMQRFGFHPNAVQRLSAEAVRNSKNPGLVIIEAPMGIGKTEAALLAAEAFPKRRVAGLLFALPTQATANGIFSRIIEWGNSQSQSNKRSISLAHGLAAMNEEYLLLKSRTVSCEDEDGTGLTVHDFFSGSKQALLADFVVGTVDQVLMAALRTKHFMLRHLGLQQKVVIIDECHAYDTYMSEYLERTLNWLGRYNTPVVLLSATLPYSRRAALMDAYLGRNGNPDEPWRNSVGYPLITWSDGNTVHQKMIPYEESKREVRIVSHPDAGNSQLAEILEILREELSDGGCAAVIVNTVRKAQLLAEGLKQELQDFQVLLLHSRFLSEDRLENENELLRLAGKHSNINTRDGLVIIGTQVIEQSLDYDADVMITELCPMDLLLQRMGRLHRHRHHDDFRPAKLRMARCHVLGTGDKLDTGSTKVYPEYLLMRTGGFLPKTVCIPDDIARLVQDTYDEEVPFSNEPSGYADAFAREHTRQEVARNNARTFRLPPPWKDDTINRLLEGDPDLDEEHGLAQVRDGQFALEVIVLFRCGDALTRAPWRYSDSYSADICPDEKDIKNILAQRLRLPAAIQHMTEDSFVLPESWKDSALFKGQRLIIVDINGEVTTGGMVYGYNKEYGLIIRKEGD